MFHNPNGYKNNMLKLEYSLLWDWWLLNKRSLKREVVIILQLDSDEVISLSCLIVCFYCLV